MKQDEHVKFFKKYYYQWERTGNYKKFIKHHFINGGTQERRKSSKN